MTMLTLEPSDRFLANSSELFQHYGIEMEVGYDFDHYREMLTFARPDQHLGEPFNPDIHEMTPSNALWMIGRNETGEIIHTQALRMLDMNGQSIAEYFTHRFRDFPPPVNGIDLGRSRFKAGPYAKRGRGRVCYNGEFWIKPGSATFRGQGLSTVLGRYAFFQAMQHWDPDHMVGFMVNQVACKGFPQRLGWMNTQPGALKWFLEGSDKPIEAFMTFMNRDDLHYVLDLPMKELVALAA